jgi:hypothetical protein
MSYPCTYENPSQGRIELKTNGHRTFTWLANSCVYSGSEVYIGIAPGIEIQKLSEVLGSALYIEFPHRSIPITSHTGSPQNIVLRLAALRDPSICTIEHTGQQGDVSGFERVRLLFDLSKAPAISQVSRQVNSTNGNFNPPAVVAFLLTIGMPVESEKHFFNGVITQFLDQSWSSFPKMLREIGCVEPARGS